MTSAPTREEFVVQRVTRRAPRFGYLVAVAINGFLLWFVHQQLDWEWPRFLTTEFEELLPLLTFSFVVSIVANVVYFRNDGWPIKPVGEMITAAIGFVVALRVYQVFPFDFSGYDVDWSWLARLIVIIAMVGAAVGFIAQVVKLAAGPIESGEAP